MVDITICKLTTGTITAATELTIQILMYGRRVSENSLTPAPEQTVMVTASSMPQTTSCGDITLVLPAHRQPEQKTTRRFRRLRNSQQKRLDRLIRTSQLLTRCLNRLNLSAV